MLNIENLHVATLDGKKILNGVNLRIGAGEAGMTIYIHP